jgi:hypothetical protein
MHTAPSHRLRPCRFSLFIAVVEMAFVGACSRSSKSPSSPDAGKDLGARLGADGAAIVPDAFVGQPPSTDTAPSSSADVSSRESPPKPDAREGEAGPTVFPQPPDGIPLSTPGWRSSESPLCDDHRGQAFAFAVWSDARGVFALVQDLCIPSGFDMPSCTFVGEAAQGTFLRFNDGNAWRTLLDPGTLDYSGLSGFPGGPLLVTGWHCGVTLVDPVLGTTTCSLPAEPTGDMAVVSVASAEQAYAVSDGKLWEYRAGTWQVVLATLPEKINALWASPDIVYLAGEYQPYAWQSQVLTALPNAPAATYTSVWALGVSDVWFGNAFGQLVHYDGARFRTVQASTFERGGVKGLWGADNQLFFRSADDFGRVVGEQAQPLLTLPGPGGGLGTHILGLWGISAKEVFISLDGPVGLDTSTCSARYLLWFDGVSFHRF